MSKRIDYIVERRERLSSPAATYHLLGTVERESGTFYVEIATFVGGRLAWRIAKALNEGELDD